MHEEQGPTTFFPTLGGIIDGKEGMIKPNAERYWNLMMAFEYVWKHPISSDMTQRLLGHAMVLLVLNRSGMGIFRSLYDFAGQNFKRKMLWGSAIRECKIFSGVIPLLVADMRRPWSSEVFCSDASPDGYGICERSLGEQDVSNIGLWQERWRYKRSTPEDWCPRERFFRYDPLSDLRSARADPEAMEQTDLYVRNEEFEEVPKDILSPDGWKVVLRGKWVHRGEHIIGPLLC